MAPRTFETLKDRYQENDGPWLLFHLLDRGAGRASRFFGDRAAQREVSRGLPGTNTRAANRQIWNDYDWSEAGEEWSPSEEWQHSVVEHLLTPNLPPNAAALEIGPGAGRWTSALIPAVSELTVVDISDQAIELCRQRFGGEENVTFMVNDGANLPEIADASIDFVWSFDVFVHIAPDDQMHYQAELARIMKPGATGLIHHGGEGGGKPKAWRSSMTSERFAEGLRDAGLEMVEQLDAWGPDEAFQVPTEGDVVTRFRRPA